MSINRLKKYAEKVFTVTSKEIINYIEKNKHRFRLQYILQLHAGQSMRILIGALSKVKLPRFEPHTVVFPTQCNER